MAATTTPSIHSLIPKIKADYPELQLEKSSSNAWNPQRATVYYEPTSSPPQLLHEVGHAILEHSTYQRDISLLRMERDAWNKATELASQYGVRISQDDVESHIDTYREWLHARSICPKCSANGVQIDKTHYRCMECQARWRVNDARACQLRRYLK